jgi:hypothetical protein
MQFLDRLDYVFWIPLVLWVPLFFWFMRCSYPLFFKKMVKKGKKWAYMPEKFGKNSPRMAIYRLLNVLFSLVVSLGSSIGVVWALNKWTQVPAVYGFASAIAFLVFAMVLYRLAVGKVAVIFQSAYFLEYRRAHYESDSKGKMQSEADIHNRAIWSFTKNLRHAESHGRLWKYVNAMAKTKKIPPDILAEVY